MADDGRTDETPYWVLISILMSTVPMSDELARRLHEVAFDLFRKDGARAPVECGLARGEVENLQRELALGTITGPAFEARLETERGAGLVRFLLTRPGIELLGRGGAKN
jgi:hypothetical protein